ncbi:ATP-binding protein, partial [Xylella fastidiosa subsp. multiplex]|nr:ATP-binding protein [Xylella fastidiosa subsp. multiplex]
RRVAGHEQDMHRLAHEITPTAIYYLRGGNSPGEVIRQLGDMDPSYRDLPKAQVALIKRVLDIVDTEEAMRDSSQRAFVSIA